MGVPYIPFIGLVGSDLVKRRDDMLLQPDPFHPERQTLVVKAMRPDVALVHGLRADRAGNVDMGDHTEDVLLAEASRTVIVSVEELVPQVDADHTEGTFIPGVLVHSVVHAPFGAHPGGFAGRYFVDAAHMRWYAEQSRDDAAFADYLRQTTFDVPSHEAYVARFVDAGALSGDARLQAAI